jgi:hypothetical protein
MNEISKTERLLKSVRQMPLYRQLVPMEAAIGWPIPSRKDDEVYMKLLFHGQGASPEGKGVALYPPFAALTLRWDNGLPVEYVSFRFRNPAPELDWEGIVGLFPHEAVASLTKKDYLQKRQELLQMYDALFQGLETGKPLSDEWNAQFTALLRLLVEPDLEPYYRALAPGFFDHFMPI